MDITFYTALLSLVWASALIGLLCLAQKSRRLVKLFGVWPLLLLVGVVVGRCLLPVELPAFTQAVALPGPVRDLNTLLFSSVGKDHVTPLGLLVALWALGVCAFLGRTAWGYLSFRWALARRGLPLSHGDPAWDWAAASARELGIRRFRVTVLPSLRSPMLCGFFVPHVLLPDFPYGQGDYRCVFRHEFTHWKHGDLWVRLLAELLRDLFWWNPLFRLLQKSLSQTLELKCDMAVAQGLTEEERLGYVETLRKTLVFSHLRRKASAPCSCFLAEFSSRGGKDLLQRADVILNYRPKPLRLVVGAVLTGALLAAVVLLSYAFVVTPQYDPADCVILDRKDGSFYLFTDRKIVAAPFGVEEFPDYRAEGFPIRQAPK